MPVLADRTNGRAYATELCLSVCLSSVMYSVAYVLRLKGASYRKTVWWNKQEMAYGKSNGHVTDDVVTDDVTW